MKDRSDANRNPSGRTGTHKMTKSPEYVSWVEMRRRCNAKPRVDHTDYTSLGITVCERWESFSNFYADMGPKPSPKHTLDRRENSGNYEPSNCRWATHSEQNANRKTAILLTWNGQTHCVAEWARITGIKEVTLLARIRRYKWPIEKALSSIPTGEVTQDGSCIP